MILLVLLGAGMFAISLVMLLKPQSFSTGLISFSEKRWFHSFEMFSRLILGLLFLLVADTTPYPIAFKALGGLLCFVFVFLLLIGVKRHRQFAQRVASFQQLLRPMGVFGVLLGSWILYFGLSHYV